MPLSMYQASISVFTRSLAALDAILDKAVAHAEAKKIAPDALLTARLFPDMFTFAKQVQLATDFAKGAGVAARGRRHSEIRRHGKDVPGIESADRKNHRLSEQPSSRSSSTAATTRRSRFPPAPTNH